jgi:hypothetical protein
VGCYFSECAGKSDDTKDRFYEKLARVLDHFPKYHMKKFVRRFQLKLERDIATFINTLGLIPMENTQTD